MTKQYDLFGGEPPSQSHSPTSKAAARSILPRIGELHLKIIRFLRGCNGATDEEMQTGIPMKANTQRPRRRELELWGTIIDSGRVRATVANRAAVIWVLSPPPKEPP